MPAYVFLALRAYVCSNARGPLQPLASDQIITDVQPVLLQSIKERIVSVTSTSCSGRFGDGATAEFVPSIHIGSGARAAWYPGQGSVSYTHLTLPTKA